MNGNKMLITFSEIVQTKSFYIGLIAGLAVINAIQAMLRDDTQMFVQFGLIFAASMGLFWAYKRDQ